MATHSKIYQVWSEMKYRCQNPNSKDYGKYGGRGIAVCERWQRFENFYADMGEAPQGMTLGRIDNDRGYAPANCEWQTRIQQNRNSRWNKPITLNGETLLFTDWCRRIGISKAGLRRRLKYWPLEDALTLKTGFLKGSWRRAT